MTAYCPDCLAEVVTYAFLIPYTCEWLLHEQCSCKSVSNTVKWFIKTPPFYPSTKPTDFPFSVRMHHTVADAVVMIEDYFEYLREENASKRAD